MKKFWTWTKIIIYLVIIILLLLSFYKNIIPWINNTIFITVFTGTTIFVFGQLLSRFILDPIQKQKEIIGKIANAITFYGNKFPFINDEGKIQNIDELTKSSDEVRGLASELRASRYLIPFYIYFSKLKLVRSNNDIKDASSNLIGWSNSFFSNQIPNDRHIFRKEIAKALGIELE